MKFIGELHEGEKISGIYLCKHKQGAVTKNGKPCILSSDKENCRNTVGGQVLPLKGGVAYGIFNIYCDYPLCSHRLHIGNKKRLAANTATSAANL